MVDRFRRLTVKAGLLEYLDVQTAKGPIERKI